MRSENLQFWLVEVTREERLDMAKWDRVIDIIQMASRNGRLLTKCEWKTLVLPHNVNENFWSIRLVEVLWKTLLGVVNHPIGAAVNSHYILHGFCVSRGKGTAYLEDNIL